MRPALVASLAVVLLTACLAGPVAGLAAEFSISDKSASGNAGLQFYRVHPLNDSLVEDSEIFRKSAAGPSASMPEGTRLLPLRTTDGSEKWLLVEEPPYSLSRHIKEAHATQGDYGDPLLEVVLDEQGAGVFERITADNIGRKLAIALDGLAYSAPVVQEKISGGKFIISGQFTFCEVQDLASVIRAGALPPVLNE